MVLFRIKKNFLNLERDADLGRSRLVLVAVALDPSQKLSFSETRSDPSRTFSFSRSDSYDTVIQFESKRRI